MGGPPASIFEGCLQRNHHLGRVRPGLGMGTERAKNEKQRINKGSVSISLSFCQLSVCLSICLHRGMSMCLSRQPSLALLASAWLCVAVFGSACLLGCASLCLALLGSEVLWELMGAYESLWKPFSLKSRLSQFWRSKLRSGDRALG